MLSNFVYSCTENNEFGSCYTLTTDLIMCDALKTFYVAHMNGPFYLYVV